MIIKKFANIYIINRLQKKWKQIRVVFMKLIFINMENRAFEASEGMTFVRKSDNARFGHFIYLSIIDSIDNYTEEPMTEEEIKELEEFNKKINKIEKQEV